MTASRANTEVMTMGRLDSKVAVVVGAGQTPGQTIGNGRATAVLFGREGAHVVAVDRDLDAAEATVTAIRAEGGTALALAADITVEPDIERFVSETVSRLGRIDILHNNVGVGLAAGDGPVAGITSEAFDRVTTTNLRGMVMTCKHVLTVMQAQGSGVIVNISSVAAVTDYPNIAYKTSKAGVIALTENLALTYAPQGIRVNCILPGLMNTPMAIEPRVGRDGLSREQVIALRDSKVPLGKMGTAWDVAEAALFLASPQARFITGVALTVDGGQRLKIG
jgi:NAD(P)-dependent dehydrogenase (short-subunit alcohol dehydrogenase family)